MPQISQITKQKKRERFNIFLDGQYAFSVSNYTLLEHNLKIGKVLTGELITNILSKEQRAQLTDLAVRFLSLRQRSEKETVDYLIKKIAQKNEVKFNIAAKSPVIGEVLKKLKKYNYINDLEFAKWFASSRLNAKSPKSLKFIKLELKLKGISDEVLEKVFKSVPNEVDSAKKALAKKFERWKDLDGLTLKKKSYSYLLSKGFDFDVIKEAFAFLQKKR